MLSIIREIFSKYPDPATGKSIDEAGRIIALRNEAGVIKFILEFEKSEDALDFNALKSQLEEEIRRVEGVRDVQIVTSAPSAPIVKPSTTPKLPTPNQGHTKGIKRIFAIASGKGGVGKSTITSNLAVALQLHGKKIGLLDADLYGPSQVMMMGAKGKPQGGQGHILPTQVHGVKMISIGQMIPDGEAVIWRGPMLMKALDQLLNDVEWGELDALLIDLPPGTGDVQLSLAQKVNLSGVFIVTTPQDIALIDARRAISMFRKLSVPILGIIENMATHICSNCGHEEHIFGQNGARREAELNNIPFLGSLPLSLKVRRAGDEGNPIALQGEGFFADIAARIIAGKLI